MNLLVIGIGHKKDLIIGIGSNFSYRASLFLMKYRVSLIHRECDDLQIGPWFYHNICSKTIVKAKSTIVLLQ